MENAKPPLYFVNGLVDYLLIGGASILAFGLFRAFHDGVTMTHLYPIAAFLTIICNHPHFCATNFRLYHSRKNILQFPVTALVVPILISAGVVASFYYPDAVAPLFVKLFILWSPYHFSGQSVGISMIYARRAGFQVGVWERRALSGFIFGAFISTLLTYETTLNGLEYYGLTYPTLGIPEWVVPVAKVFMYVCGVGLVGLAARWSFRHKRLLPPIVLLPALTHYVWFVGGTYQNGFQEFVPFFHSLQYLLVAWTVQLKEAADKKGAETSRGFVLWQTGRWLALNMLGGYAMFELLPYVFPSAKTNNNFAMGIVAAGVQMHHFFVDGVIWKLKSQTAGSPLMANFWQFWKRKPTDDSFGMIPSGAPA